MGDTKTIKVKTRFVSYQGTGVHSGVRQDFIRLAGCRVPCPLRANCDQPEALGSSGDMIPLSKLVADSETDWVHITGGEPAEHENMVELCDLAARSGKMVQVQTSGSIPIEWKERPFVSVSPKQPYIKVEPSEIVLIACEWMTLSFAERAVQGQSCPVFVVPEAKGGKFCSSEAKMLADKLSAVYDDVRMGLQSHLIWEVN